MMDPSDSATLTPAPSPKGRGERSDPATAELPSPSGRGAGGERTPPDKATHTTCPYCGVGCGVKASGGTAPEVQGDEQHPSNFGRLCSKGSALADTIGPEDRLTVPSINGRTVSWNNALDHVADGFSRIIREHGPDAVAFYVSGQLLTEDYYVANKLMKGYIGSANIDTNSRLCMSSAVVGHKRAFGNDLVPICYEDLEQADLIVLVGSNLAWCHPILFQRIQAARAQRPEMKLVVIDPRRTATAEEADLHLPIAPGADVRLFNGLLTHLADHEALDSSYIADHCDGLEDALQAARSDGESLENIALACGLEPADLRRFFALFREHAKTVTVFSQGVNQSSSGSDKANAIINCHLATGRIGKPGAGPFSVTGQPNAMGGREVGGLASTLAAHMDLDNTEHQDRVQRFWNSPTIATKPGLKAVDLFEAVHSGQVKAVWIMATNPAVSLPNTDRVREALQKCELVVVSDCVAKTDTTALANVLLPAAAWGEKNGTVTNSERRISRQRPFLPPPGEARADWAIICSVAKRMGFGAAFNYAGPEDIFDEHSRLSGFENNGARQFDISGLAGLGRSGYQALQPIQWPVNPAHPQGCPRLFSDGRFDTADGRARLIAVRHRAPANTTNAQYPLVLNTGRIRDQWHTMTRSGRSPRLSQHLPEPFVSVHPQDAAAAGLQDQGLAVLRSRWGSAHLRVQVNDSQRRGELFAPMHWNDRFAGNARVGAVVNPAVDPISGEPEFKHTPAHIAALPAQYFGFALSRWPLKLQSVDYWARIRGVQHERYEFASQEQPDSAGDWGDWARACLNLPEGADWLEYRDARAGVFRAAGLLDGRVMAVLFLGSDPKLPDRRWLGELFAAEALSPLQRRTLLAGRPAQAGPDPGPTVCACFGVGRNTICRAIASQGLQTPEAIGSALRAGTNCGSCVPELRKLLAQATDDAA